MKKNILLLILMMLSAVLASCGGETTDIVSESAVNEQTSAPINTESVVEDTPGEDKDSDEITFSYSYKVPGKNIVIDVPDYQEMEKGYTQLYILHGIKYVAITANDTGIASNVSEAHDSAFEKFKNNIQNYSYVNSLTVISDSVENINGIEMYKYEGTLNCGRDTIYDAYVIGYSFIMDGVPCTVTGSVIDQAQDQEMIDEMRATVEAMILTLRSER